MLTFLNAADPRLEYLEQMVEVHAGGAVFLAVDSTRRRLRGNPRLDALLARIDSPPTSTPLPPGP